MDTIGLVISMLLTLMVFSYLLGDNPLFRLAEHIFVGVSVAYAVLVAWHLVLAPTFLTAGGSLLNKVPPALLCLLLIFTVRPFRSPVAGALGSVALAFLIGVGAALAIGGGLFGTLFPQTVATAGIDLSPSAPAYANAPNGMWFLHNDFLANVVVIMGTVGTLFYFNFTYRQQGALSGAREWFVSFWAGIGRWIILITIGALFTNTVSARIALLLSRLQFLANGWQTLSGG